jgi:hypothetical protein
LFEQISQIYTRHITRRVQQVEGFNNVLKVLFLSGLIVYFAADLVSFDFLTDTDLLVSHTYKIIHSFGLRQQFVYFQTMYLALIEQKNCVIIDQK